MQRFMSNCHDILMAIADLVPDDINRLIDSLFEELLPICHNIPDMLMGAEVKSSDSMRRIHCSVQDLCAVLQMSARMVPSLTGTAFHDKFSHSEKCLKGYMTNNHD